MPRQRTTIIVVCGAWLVCVAVATANAVADSPVTVESLLHSAMNLYHTPSAVARAGRLVAISEYIAGLDPNDVRARRLLADMYHSQGKREAAADNAQKLFRAEPKDFAAGARWVRFCLNTYNRAPERRYFLKSILNNEQYSRPLRSVAAVELARVYTGQGATKDAVNAIDQALKLDPLNQAALFSRSDLMNNPTPVDRAKIFLALLEGNPRAYWIARDLAGMLCRLGLYDQGLKYYRHTWSLWQGNRPVSEAPADFAAEYVSALLDADKPNIAVSLFAPAVERLQTSTEFGSLMIEAFTKAGQNDKAAPLRKAVEEQYRRELLSHRVAEGLENTGVKDTSPDADAKKMTADVAVNLAWYYLLVEKRPDEASRSIAEAVELGAGGDAVNLCTGAAKLARGDAEGLKLIEPLVDTYPLAAAYVAQYELASGQTKKGTRTLLAGVEKGRKNLAYRMLAATAKKYDITIPPAKDSASVAARVEKFDPRYLQMGLEPEKFIRITVAPARKTTALCEPIFVNATLENISSLPVSVDAWGLLDRQLGLEVLLGDRTVSFASMPMLIWPSPRYLQPKQKVIASARLDVGEIARFLANYPLLPIALRVHPIVSPVSFTPNRPGAKPRVISGLEPMKLQPITVHQDGLLASEATGAEQYNQALANLRKALAEGDLQARVLSARRIAALLAWMRDVGNGRASVPQVIRPVMNEKYVLGLMGMALRDKSDVVRAEMITALQYADMGSAMLNEVGLVVDDPSPLVRFRVAELIGASGTKGSRTLIDMYAKDADPCVRTMARAFLYAWSRAKSKEESRKAETNQ